MADGKSISCSSKACQAYQACHVKALDKRVLQVVIYLIDKGYKIGTYAFCRSHSDTGGVHDDGLAVDISSIDGVALNTSAAKKLALKVDKIIFNLEGEIAPKQIITGGVGATRELDPDFTKYNRISKDVSGQAAVDGFGSDTIAGHTDHIHVGY